MKKKVPVSCDWKAGSELRKEKNKAVANKSRLYRHGEYRWRGVKAETYKSSGADWSAITRHTLIGSHGETAKFHLRYFEIAPGGYSSHETHRHEHVVVCVRGKGRVIAGRNTHEMNFLDTLYLSPSTPHQLTNPFRKPFGFLCIVNAKRDKPSPVKTNPQYS